MTLYDIRMSDAQRELILTGLLAMQSTPLGADAETRVMIDDLYAMLRDSIPHDSNDAEEAKTQNDFTA